MLLYNTCLLSATSLLSMPALTMEAHRFLWISIRCIMTPSCLTSIKLFPHWWHPWYCLLEYESLFATWKHQLSSRWSNFSTATVCECSNILKSIPTAFNPHFLFIIGGTATVHRVRHNISDRYSRANHFMKRTAPTGQQPVPQPPQSPQQSVLRQPQ